MDKPQSHKLHHFPSRHPFRVDFQHLLDAMEASKDWDITLDQALAITGQKDGATNAL